MRSPSSPCSGRRRTSPGSTERSPARTWPSCACCWPSATAPWMGRRTWTPGESTGRSPSTWGGTSSTISSATGSASTCATRTVPSSRLRASMRHQARLRGWSPSLRTFPTVTPSSRLVWLEDWNPSAGRRQPDGWCTFMPSTRPVSAPEPSETLRSREERGTQSALGGQGRSAP